MAARVIRPPRGRALTCQGWAQEAAMRMLMNCLDPEVAENPDELIVYGGTGKAARNWECFEALVRSLKTLHNDETVPKNMDVYPCGPGEQCSRPLAPEFLLPGAGR